MDNLPAGLEFKFEPFCKNCMNFCFEYESEPDILGVYTIRVSCVHLNKARLTCEYDLK